MTESSHPEHRLFAELQNIPTYTIKATPENNPIIPIDLKEVDDDHEYLAKVVVELTALPTSPKSWHTHTDLAPFSHLDNPFQQLLIETLKQPEGHELLSQLHLQSSRNTILMENLTQRDSSGNTIIGGACINLIENSIDELSHYHLLDFVIFAEEHLPKEDYATILALCQEEFNRLSNSEIEKIYEEYHMICRNNAAYHIVKNLHSNEQKAFEDLQFISLYYNQNMLEPPTLLRPSPTGKEITPQVLQLLTDLPIERERWNSHLTPNNQAIANPYGFYVCAMLESAANNPAFGRRFFISLRQELGKNTRIRQKLLSEAPSKTGQSSPILFHAFRGIVSKDAQHVFRDLTKGGQASNPAAFAELVITCEEHLPHHALKDFLRDLQALNHHIPDPFRKRLVENLNDYPSSLATQIITPSRLAD